MLRQLLSQLSERRICREKHNTLFLAMGNGLYEGPVLIAQRGSSLRSLKLWRLHGTSLEDREPNSIFLDEMAESGNESPMVKSRFRRKDRPGIG